jgi:hypothetical protein
VETLLRQYIDESTEYEVRQVEPKPESKPESKHESKPEPIPVPKTEPIPVPKTEPKPEPKPEPKLEPRVEVIPVEVKPNISFNDQTETFEIPVEEETLKIGDDIQLNAMSFEDLENSGSCDIDLGIVEL